jgi:hypothetical protein
LGVVGGVQGAFGVVAVVESGGEVAVVFGVEPVCGQARFDVDSVRVESWAAEEASQAPLLEGEDATAETEAEVLAEFVQIEDHACLAVVEDVCFAFGEFLLAADVHA